MAKEFFKDLPNTTTPLTATRLNGLLDGDEALGNLVVDSIKSKNLADPNQFVSGAFAVNSTSEATDGNTNAVTTGWIPCEPNTNYTISGGYNRLRWQTKASNGTITFAQDGGITLTTNSTAAYLRCYCYYASSSIIPSSITNIQIEKGGATSFSPYQNLTSIPEPVLVDRNDFLTVNSGYTISHFNVVKIGKQYIGTVNVSKDTAFTNANSIPFILKNKPLIIQSTYTFCGLGTDDWRINNIGYCYFGADGNVIIVDQNNVGTYKSAAININYVSK